MRRGRYPGVARESEAAGRAVTRPALVPSGGLRSNPVRPVQGMTWRNKRVLTGSAAQWSWSSRMSALHVIASYQAACSARAPFCIRIHRIRECSSTVTHSSDVVQGGSGGQV